MERKVVKTGPITPPAPGRRVVAPPQTPTGPTKRANHIGRGNEQVSVDDLDSRAERTSTTQWDRVPGAIEYLRRYVEHLEGQARDKTKFRNSAEAIKLMDLVFRFKDQISDLIKSPAEKIYDILRFTVVPEVMLDHDEDSVTIAGIGRCNVMDDISVKVLDKDEFYKWLVSAGHEDLITETVNAQTLAAWMRARLKDKEATKIPDGLIDLKPVTRAQITRQK